MSKLVYDVYISKDLQVFAFIWTKNGQKHQKNIAATEATVDLKQDKKASMTKLVFL